MQLGAGMPPAMPPPMPLGFPPNSGAAMKGVNGPAASPFGSPLMPTVPLSQQSSPGMPPGMATPPVASKFSRKAYGGRRHAKKYVDVLNPSGQSSNAPAALPSNLLPMMPGPSTEFKGNFFVPSPVTADTSDERTDEQILDQPPAIGNPSSRPSSRNENEDGGDQQSQDPDPPPQEMNAAPPPMFFDPMAFSQSKAQASPKRSRYPGVRNN
ncbi:Protein transport protein Sec16A [Desmophyllum pertusum]|uniref:Protein transport protein Sec16A n=1 Tax=Desmophyllum pertusum TaxID=174260 RepID=A0A9X0CFH4_9CNID|nr:Protein transport protein Sec16A [Desmophyllum pertusum]